MNQFEPNDLLIFARVAELGSFSKAAERLGLPKSTVSRRLALLEERLGERLLLRTTRRQALTDFGQQLLVHAREIANETDAVLALRDHRQAAPSGRLRVSMPADLANLVLAEALAAFVQRHPGIDLLLDLTPRRVDLLEEGFDLVVRMGDLPDDATLAARRLTHFPEGLYAAPAYLAQHPAPDHPDELGAHVTVRLLTRSGGPAPWTLHRGTERWHGDPPCHASANSPELLVKWTAAGLGIAAVPEHYARQQVEQGRLVRVLPDWSLPGHTAWAVFPERRLMPSKTRAFIDMLREALAQCPPPD